MSLDWEGDEPRTGETALARAGHDLLVAGHGKIMKRHKGPLVATEVTIGACDVESLAAAVRDDRRCCAQLPEPIFIAPGGEAGFDHELFDEDPIRVEVSADSVSACVDVLIKQAESIESYQRLVSPVAARHGCIVRSVRLTDEFGQNPSEMEWPSELPGERDEYLATQSARPRVVEVRMEAVEPSTPCWKRCVEVR